MSALTKIIVLAADATGKTTVLDSAEVALVEKSAVGKSVWPHGDLAATHSFSGGHYEPGSPSADPTAGQYLLVVRAKDKSPVVQNLTFSTSGKTMKVVEGWGRVGNSERALTVALNSWGVTKKEREAHEERCLVTVTLYPVQFFVSITTKLTDASYTAFARGRFGYLFATGKLNPGAVSILLDMKKKREEYSVKSLAKEEESLVLCGTKPTQERLGIPDFYAKLDELGKGFPSSVVEAVVWSHAWHQGPLLGYDYDALAYDRPRDPMDRDGRAKDFSPGGPIESGFPGVKNALAEGGIFRVAGCSHMSSTIGEMRAALGEIAKGSARDSLYDLKFGEGWLVTSLDYTKWNIGQLYQSRKVARMEGDGDCGGYATYLGMAASMLGSKVRGAPAACEGNMGKIAAPSGRMLATMKILSVPYNGEDGKVAGGLENRDAVAYYQQEFGDFFERDELGYANYEKMSKAPLPSPKWSPRRAVHWVNVNKKNVRTSALRVATGLEVWFERGGPFAKGIARSEPGGEFGFLFVAPNADVNAIKHIPYPDVTVRALNLIRAPGSDIGIFVTMSGKVLLRRRTVPNGQFEPYSVTLPILKAVLSRVGEDVNREFVPIGSLPTGDQIEAVSPKVYW